MTFERVVPGATIKPIAAATAPEVIADVCRPAGERVVITAADDIFNAEQGVGQAGAGDRSAAGSSFRCAVTGEVDRNGLILAGVIGKVSAGAAVEIVRRDITAKGIVTRASNHLFDIAKRH